MAEHAGSPESLTENFHDGNSSPSSSSGSDEGNPSPAESLQSKAYRLFGRDKPVHKVLGGGKPADIFLWRNMKNSGIVLGVGTALWLSFELLEYHLITLVCHLLMVSLVTLFLWSNASVFIHKSPVHIPEVAVPEECILEVASALRIEINRALVVLRGIATGPDLKKFLGVIAGLWVVSVIGNWFNILTLFYISFVSLFTMPLLYEKYEDQVDSFAEKAMVEIKKHYAEFDAKVLSQIPIGGLKKD